MSAASICVPYATDAKSPDSIRFGKGDMSEGSRQGTAGLALAALGVVYGDIGTSPLYTIREIFGETGRVPLDAANVVGAVSVIVWALTAVVTLKYVLLILRADNRGEGGIMALVVLAA